MAARPRAATLRMSVVRTPDNTGERASAEHTAPPCSGHRTPGVRRGTHRAAPEAASYRSQTVTGLPTTFGIEARRDACATSDDPYVARLRGAGAILIATTNVAQLLAFPETDNPVYGRTSNPWNHERFSGGSSGGEAVLVGAGASPLGLGTDIGGSIRIPATWCGAVGFKPSVDVTPDVGTGSFPLGGPITSEVGVLAPSSPERRAPNRTVTTGGPPRYARCGVESAPWTQFETPFSRRANGTTGARDELRRPGASSPMAVETTGALVTG